MTDATPRPAAFTGILTGESIAAAGPPTTVTPRVVIELAVIAARISTIVGGCAGSTPMRDVRVSLLAQRDMIIDLADRIEAEAAK